MHGIVKAWQFVLLISQSKSENLSIRSGTHFQEFETLNFDNQDMQ